MSKREPQFNLRLSAELKSMIEEAAKENNRSINSEIVYRLQQSFDGGGSETQLDIDQNAQANNYDKFKELIAEQARIIKRYSELAEKSSENMATMIDYIQRTTNTNEEVGDSINEVTSEETRDKKGFGEFS